ncbi:hypothetical protein F5146DRAFT_1208952, partial [Armillaria mellea]
MSRPDIALDSLFEADTTLNIEASVDDIELYIADRISKSRRLASHLIGEDGMILQEVILTMYRFLLARLHMNSLAETKNQRTLKEALAKLPENLMGAYAEILESRINSQNDDDRVLAFHIFGWIAFAKHPLTVLELQHALAVDLDSDETDFEPDNIFSEELLGSVCGGLVFISDIGKDEWFRDHTVKFAHYTTQEYFMSQKEILFPQLQETITDTCLKYMLFNNIQHHYYLEESIDLRPDSIFDNVSFHCRDKDYPFLHYSLNYWIDHA